MFLLMENRLSERDGTRMDLARRMEYDGLSSRLRLPMPVICALDLPCQRGEQSVLTLFLAMDKVCRIRGCCYSCEDMHHCQTQRSVY